MVATREQRKKRGGQLEKGGFWTMAAAFVVDLLSRHAYRTPVKVLWVLAVALLALGWSLSTPEGTERRAMAVAACCAYVALMCMTVLTPSATAGDLFMVGVWAYILAAGTTRVWYRLAR